MARHYSTYRPVLNIENNKLYSCLRCNWKFQEVSETLSDNYVTYHIVSKPVETSLRESENTCFLVVEAKMLLLSLLDFNKPQECCVYLPRTSFWSSYINMYRRRGTTKFYTLTDYLCPEVQIFITVYTINLF